MLIKQPGYTATAKNPILVVSDSLFQYKAFLEQQMGCKIQRATDALHIPEYQLIQSMEVSCGRPRDGLAYILHPHPHRNTFQKIEGRELIEQILLSRGHKVIHVPEIIHLPLKLRKSWHTK